MKLAEAIITGVRETSHAPFRQIELLSGIRNLVNQSTVCRSGKVETAIDKFIGDLDSAIKETEERENA